jgi:tRNA isopentenyl-2-thiomethyl-A-37 hydroxylase MiaE
MDHNKDYDRNNDREDAYSNDLLKEVVGSALDVEKEMMQNYLVAADRIHGNEALKRRLREFAEGNAKRSSQLEEELNQL